MTSVRIAGEIGELPLLKCPKCHSPIADGARFCNACGSKVAVAEAAPVVAHEPASPGPEALPEAAGSGEPRPTPGAQSLPPASTNRSPALFIGLAVVAVVIAAIALSTMAPRFSALNTSASQSSSASSNSSGDGPSDADSYTAVRGAYDRCIATANEFGKARTDGVYGGSGFAYDVFNPKIADPKRSIRQDLVNRCQSWLNRIRSEKDETAALSVSASYQQDKAAVVHLYGLLEARAVILMRAAKVALNDPREKAWRPILTPDSTNARLAYQNAVASAEPVQH